MISWRTRTDVITDSVTRTKEIERIGGINLWDYFLIGVFRLVQGVCQKLRLGHALVLYLDLCRLKRAHSILGHSKKTDLKKPCPILFLSTFNYWVDPFSIFSHFFWVLRSLSFCSDPEPRWMLAFPFSSFVRTILFLLKIYNTIVPLSFSLHSNLL